MENLSNMNYDDIIAFYYTVDRTNKVLILQYLARQIMSELDRKSNLQNIQEIRDYVRILPTLQVRQRQIDQMANELRN